MKKADTQNLPMDSAAFHVMEEIQNHNNLGGMKKQLLNISNESNFAPKYSHDFS